MNGKIFVLVSLLTMFVLLLLRRVQYGVQAIKIVPLTLCVAGMGLLGTYVMFYIENGGWYGRSFFGALLFYPILLWPVAKIFCIHVDDLLDLATPPGLALLALYKYNCYVDGCCGGKALWFTPEGVPVYFPSQIAEMIVAILIMLHMLHIEKKRKGRGVIYAYTIIFYGISRFILTKFRWQQDVFLFQMPAGSLWSVVAVIEGFVWLLFIKIKSNRLVKCKRNEGSNVDN